MLPNLPTISLGSALPSGGKKAPAYPAHLLTEKPTRRPSLRLRLGDWLIRAGLKLKGQSASGQTVLFTR
jgi:hypothetical protein